MWWVRVGGGDRAGTVRSAVGLGWNGMQANDARAREGILRGAVCGLVCSQGHMGASQLEIELGRGRKTRWARASERKCGQQELVGAGAKMGWQGASWGCNLSRGASPWVEGCRGIGLANGKCGSCPSNPEDKN